MTLALLMATGYLVGSIPFAYLIPRAFAGIDLREHGSGNLGATNVYRILGWKFAVPVGICDIAKGAAPVVAARATLPEHWMPLTVGLAAIVGHVFSIFLRFRGGKGVATSAGVVLGLVPIAVAGSVVVWGVVLMASGYMSLASMVGAAAFPVATWLLRPGDAYSLWAGIGLAGFILYTHRSNVGRLLSGTESRFGRRREA